MIGRGVHRTGLVASLLAAALIVACEDNPTAPANDGLEEGHDETLTVELTVTPDHVHILQSEVEFTVKVTDHHGEAVTDFELIQVERRADGSDTWRVIELAPAGNAYVGTYVFSSSGDYDLRVAGQRPGEADMQVLHQAAEPLHCVPAHAEAGGYRVEFETFPGHAHTGEDVTLRFWIMEPERDASGERPPITGVTGEVHVVESDASEFSYDLVEIGDGVYEAEHNFTAPDEAHVQLHYTGSDGQPAEADFHVSPVPTH